VIGEEAGSLFNLYFRFVAISPYRSNVQHLFLAGGKEQDELSLLTLPRLQFALVVRVESPAGNVFQRKCFCL
jgi:hypothetical protein